jgi:hypothetical protein
LRKAATRTIDQLWQAIANGLAAFTPAEGANISPPQATLQKDRKMLYVGDISLRAGSRPLRARTPGTGSKAMT